MARVLNRSFNVHIEVALFMLTLLPSVQSEKVVK